jgi:hypothetical protein
LKKLATLVGSAALLAAAIIPAAAAGNDCVNGTTGPFSNNTCSVKNTDVITVNNVNDAQIVNKVKIESNTGKNSASYNTLGGSVKSGNATVNATVSNVANVNTTNITAGMGGSSHNEGGNMITGPKSYNGSFIENNFAADVWNSNTASVKNDVEVDSETGENDADYNTGGGEVRSGDAWSRLVIGNHVNDNLTSIMGGAGNGHNHADNETTGPFSNNTVSLKNNLIGRVANINDMQVKNYVDVDAETGDNSANKTTLGGEVASGDAFAGVGVDTEGNINSTLVAMGGFSENDASNEVTGPDSGSNDTFIENARAVEVENWNNKCQSHNADRLDNPLWGWWSRDEGNCDVDNLGVLNDVEAESDTGDNDTDYNTGGGSVESGYAEMIQQILTHMNDVLTEIR